MSASKKSKKVGEEKRVEGATLSIDVDSFVRTRDSVVTGLATLQDAIQTLSTAYIKHTNAVLGEHGAGLEPGIESALSKLGENPLLGGIAGLNRAASPAKTEPPEEKKERKKRQHDPNAPKRPLTPFFLYMQTARPIIAADLGADAAKGAVSNEGTRRWKEMSNADKQLWTNAYKDNLRLYNARIHSYKAGNLQAKEMSDEVALAYAEQHNIDSGPSDASAQLLAENPVAVVSDDADGEEEVVPEPPVKTPKAKGGRKSKGAAKEPEPEVPKPTESAIPPPSATKAATPATDKKRKRGSAAKAAPVESIEQEEVAVEAPKLETPKPEKTKQSRKKKAKADA